MTAYYNEFDPKAAAWLRELIAAGEIAPGEVDERSIADVKAEDLAGFTQCHFFAGIGGWSLALRLAGISDDRPVWTGSCPCQSFSAAGKQGGTDDARHLWPHFHRLIRECRPGRVFGEQVAGAIGFGWLDGVFGDLEADAYRCGAVVLGAHSVGAPHIRQRLYWVADAGHERGRGWPVTTQAHVSEATNGCGLGNPGTARLHGAHDHGAIPGRVQCVTTEPGGGTPDGGLVDAECGRQPGPRWIRQPVRAEAGANREADRPVDAGHAGFWGDFDILPCRDGKARRVESGTFPLVDGLPRGVVPSGDPSASEVQATAEARVSRLKGYGNAISPQVAAAFIEAAEDVIGAAPCA